MFTGIINFLGSIAAKEDLPNQGQRLFIQTPFDVLDLGESIAIDGVCLTVIAQTQKTGSTIFVADVSLETLKRTTLACLALGSVVNLERSLTLADRLGGHMVQGHVDAIGSIAGIQDQGNSKWVTFNYPQQLTPFIVLKGSIAVNGVSLTVAQKTAKTFAVSMLEFTEKQTSFVQKKIGDFVNLEADILAKTLFEQAKPYLQKNDQPENDSLFIKKDFPDFGE